MSYFNSNEITVFPATQRGNNTTYYPKSKLVSEYSTTQTIRSLTANFPSPGSFIVSKSIIGVQLPAIFECYIHGYYIGIDFQDGYIDAESTYGPYINEIIYDAWGGNKTNPNGKEVWLTIRVNEKGTGTPYDGFIELQGLDILTGNDADKYTGVIVGNEDLGDYSLKILNSDGTLCEDNLYINLITNNWSYVPYVLSHNAPTAEPNLSKFWINNDENSEDQWVVSVCTNKNSTPPEWTKLGAVYKDNASNI